MTSQPTLDDLADDLCRWCKSPLPDTRRLGTVFCGRKCGNAYFNSLETQARREARSALTCQECGTTFAGSMQGQRFCTKACGRMWVRKHTWGYRNCRICDERFLASHPKQFMCVPPTRFMECVDRLKARIRCEAG